MAEPGSAETPLQLPPTLPPRPPDMHKGQAGRVAIVAGRVGMTGAAVLAGRGALRGGAGLVRIFCPASALPIIAAAEPCVMTVGLAEQGGDATATRAAGDSAVDSGAGHTRGLIAIRAAEQVRTPWADVAAIGPGLGLTSDVVEFVRLLLDLPVPLVLDADALNALALLDGDAGGQSQLAAAAGPRPLARVLTPHPGEFARLCDAAGLAAPADDSATARVTAAQSYARYAGGAIVVLKGWQTVVCSSAHAYINNTGNPGMATGGMGDVLTGLLAALIGQRVPPFDAACLAVWTHGRAGDLAARSIGPIGLTAADVAACLPAALAERMNSPIGFHSGGA